MDAGLAGMSWIVVRSEPLRELTARRFLELAKFSVYLPRIRERQAKGGRRIERLRPLFPSYIFVGFRGGRWWDARWCVGVAAVIMAGDGPAQLGDHVIDELRARERGGAVELPRREKFKVGDRVKVLQGPFADHFGLYAGQRAHERVLVLLALLGSTQRVELPRESIEAATP
jgi:transcriptional antiterminator RfaH